MPTKLKVVLGFALAFVLITLFEVVTQREDWPFSCYPMYSRPSPKVAKRNVIAGVSDDGEFPLTDDQTNPFNGARLIAMTRRLSGRADKGKQFMRVLGARYEKRREREHWPVLQAVRIYSESWAIRPRLAGMNRPDRSLETALYVAQQALLARLKAEAAGTEKAAPATPVPAGDRVVELEAASCGDGCSPATDALAAGGSALLLKGDGSDNPASVTARVTLDAGQYAVLVRMKVASSASADRVFVALDGKRVGDKTGVGNYSDMLPYAAWVWASRKPGLAALKLDVPTTGEHLLTLSTPSEVVVDQVWLRRKARELPVDNAPRQP